MKITPEDLKNAWNGNRGDMPLCNDLGIRNRRRLAELLIDAVPDLPRLTRAIHRASISPYCTGKEPLGKEIHMGSFEWFCKPNAETLTLIEEGQYDKRGYREVVPPEPGEIEGYGRYAKGPMTPNAEFDRVAQEHVDDLFNQPGKTEPELEKEVLRIEALGPAALRWERENHRRMTRVQMNDLIAGRWTP